MRPHRVLAVLMLAGTLAGFASGAGGAVLVTIDKTRQQMSVAVDGEPRWIWPVSTGTARYDTPNGRYTAFRMEAEHYSKEWDDAPMPHSIFFTRIGHAIHGTTHTGRLGRPASHGCVRLAPENAARLFALVRRHGLANTKVTVAGELPPAAPLVAEHRPPESERARIAQESRADAAPRVQPWHHDRRSPEGYYEPRVEVIEETYVNGTWLRRRYYPQARPQDFYWRR